MDSLSNKTETLIKNISKNNMQYEFVKNLFKNRIYDYYSRGTNGSYPLDCNIYDIFSETDKYTLMKINDLKVFKQELKYNSDVESIIIFFIIGSKVCLNHIHIFIDEVREILNEDSSSLYGWETDNSNGEKAIETTIILTGIDTWKIK